METLIEFYKYITKDFTSFLVFCVVGSIIIEGLRKLIHKN